MMYNVILYATTMLICCLMAVPLVKEAKRQEPYASNRLYYSFVALDLLAMVAIIAEDIRLGTSTDLIITAALNGILALSSLTIVYFWLEYLRKRETIALSEEYRDKTEDLVEEFQDFITARHAQLRADVESMDQKLLEAIAELEKMRDGSGSSPTLQAISDSSPLSRYDTGNIFVDAALITKRAQLEEQGVVLDAKVIVPDSVPISPTELSALFFNLIDNAAREANARGTNYVDVRAGVIAGQITLIVRNACDPALKGEVHPKQHSRDNMDDEHGWGLSIIEHICDTNNGFCSFEAENGVFTSVCMIPLS